MKLLRYLLFVIVLLAPCSAWASYVVSNLGTANNATGATATISSLSVGSNILVVVGVAENGGCGSVSDGTNSFTNQTGSVTSPVFLCIFSHFYASSFGPFTLTYTKGVSGDAVAMSVVSVTGSNGVNDAAIQNSDSGSSTVSSFSGVTTSAANEIVIEFVGWGSSATITQDSQYTTPPPNSAAQGTAALIVGGYNVIASSGTAITYLGSLSPGSPQWGLVIATWEPGAAPPATNHFLSLMGVGQ